MGLLTDDQIREFDENGFLVLENVIDRSAVLDPLIAEYEDLLGALVEGWIGEGRLDASVRNLSFGEKLVAAHAGACEFFQPMDISLPLGDIEAATPMHFGPAAFRLLVADGLLDIAGSLIGPEITSCPIQHVRMKPRQSRLGRAEHRAHLVATQWHQDRAVGREEADGTDIVTTWVAVTGADEENGCLMVVPGSHRGEMLTHCPNPQVGIPDRLIDAATTLPLPVGPGGVIVFHPMTIHGSLPNRSDRLRWSFDLRYNRTGQPKGRPQFPDFIARSRTAPETEFRDPVRWAELWSEARARLSARDDVEHFHRWPADAPVCA